jgi:hypothetical protein
MNEEDEEKDKGEVLYKWTSAGGCKACDDLEGVHEEEPSRPHPNCKCVVEEVIVIPELLFEFNIEEIIASNHVASPDDVLAVKEALYKLGYYEPPTGEINKFTDSAMYEAIRAFQRDNGLAPDGIIEPGGETAKAINDSLKFDGKMLSWWKDGNKVKSWKATSGQPDYQCSKYQGVRNKGPIPEGEWLMKQSRHQNFFRDQTRKEQVISRASVAPRSIGIKTGKWPGGSSSWGEDRVWLEPAKWTDAKGRSGFSVHGGINRGTRGCVRLVGDKMDDFAKDFKSHGKDLLIKVKYPEGDCW